jgi:hypothetical protein
VLDPVIEHRLHHHLGAGHLCAHGSLQSGLGSASDNKKGPRRAPARTASFAGGCQPPSAVRAITTIRMLRVTVFARHFLARRL